MLNECRNEPEYALRNIEGLVRFLYRLFEEAQGQMKRFSRITGTLVVVLSLLWLLFVGWSIYVGYANCKGGFGPHPSQGCGYVLHLALYVWGDSYLILYGIIALAAGLALFFLSRVSRDP